MGGAAKRDEAAFAAVVRAEHDRALRLAYLLAGDREQAEDAVAEAFARTFETWRAGKVDDVGSHLRRAVTAEAGEPRPGPHRSAVLELLARLPRPQRAAVVLRHHEGCSEAETADALGCRPGEVASLVSRGVRTLREQAAEVGLHPDDVASS